ncbi:PQQ-binding-like beta-propeller repeat protein [Undibacterium jejuense]|uniref:PQQ-binding-like beta-propeller repeat protein n=1 Tax=Undibacterium jejuense TaxID=1344949 RepID=A0A923HFD7_9BURK|nr:PilC/PilY family type IV pilus protein [Undibacterium jejuense]MBC3863527.1 PQQ-binding-like beta-propeller repeat protein [Undibacterium jejuense]
MKTHYLIATLSFAFLQVAAIAATPTTDIAPGPLDASLKVNPNVILLIDDSGSMLWTNIPDSSAQDNIDPSLSPQGVFNSQSDADSGNATDYNPVSLQSNYYNALYYNPKVTYTPWVKKSATKTTYPNADYTHLISNWVATGSLVSSGILSSGSTYVVNYSCNPNAYKTTYDFDTGKVFANKSTCLSKSGKKQYTLAAAYSVQAGQSWQKMIPQSSAAYWNLVPSGTCTPSNWSLDSSSLPDQGVTCVNAQVCTSTSACNAATPKGALMQQVTIAPNDITNLQNFANWEQYASTHILLAAYAMSNVLPKLKGINMGISFMNPPVDSQSNKATAQRYGMQYAANAITNSVTAGMDSSVTLVTDKYDSSYWASSGKMFNLSIASDTDALLDIIYNVLPYNGTPTQAALQRTGALYQDSQLPLTLNQYNSGNAIYTPSNLNGIIQYACQKNAVFVVTDGFANSTNLPDAITYAKTAGDQNAPFATSYSQSLADIALAYYDLNLRPDLPAGLVPVDTFTTGGGADKNTNLHMNTYGLTLGAKGKQFGQPSFAAQQADPYNQITSTSFWTDPTTSSALNTPIEIDDLWHATINSRGLMFTASNTNNMVTSIQNAMNDIVLRAGSQSAIAVANVNMTSTNNFAYVATYNAGGWFGDVQQYTLNQTDGTVTGGSNWSARNQLQALTKPATTRYIVTSKGTANSGMAFSSANTISIDPRLTTDMVAYLRGDQTSEASGQYRQRQYLFGDAVNASPLVISLGTGSSATTTVYQAANDGMLHAIDSTTGNELWSYIPYAVLPKIADLASPTYSHEFLVDGTPVAAAVGTKTILVGGIGSGGTGFYALDISNPKAASESDAASKALWEFPTAASDIKNMGTSSSKPSVIMTAALGQVVMVASGYNNDANGTGGDGKGHIWFLDPLTGAVKQEVVTPAVSGMGTLGFATPSAYAANPKVSVTATAVYVGDQLGNVWKFDISDSKASSSWAASRVATVGCVSGCTIGGVSYPAGHPQPITSAPELSTYVQDASNAYPIIYVGTGRLLGLSDLTDTSQQSFYAIKDSGKSVSKMDRSSSQWIGKTVTTVGGNAAAATTSSTISDPTGTIFSFANNDAWYLDYPVGGERSIGDPAFALGQITFTTNVLSSNLCSSSSFSYILSNTGQQVSPSQTQGVTTYGRSYIGNFTVSSPVIVRLTSGKVISEFNQNGQIVPMVFSSANSVPRVTSWKEIIRKFSFF